MAKFTKTKEWLIEEYVIKERSRKEIANECGLTESGLKSLLSKWNIKKEKLNLPKEKLEELINQKLPHDEIEKRLNISQTTLYRYLKSKNINYLDYISRKLKDTFGYLDTFKNCHYYFEDEVNAIK